MESMRFTLVFAAASAAALIGLVLLDACGSFEGDSGGAAPDAAVEGSAPDSSTGGDAGASSCPSLAPFCPGAVEIKCAGLDDRCFYFCPQAKDHQTAALTCTAWGGCLASVAGAANILCLQDLTKQKSSVIIVDLFQDAGAPTPDAGWASRCSPQPSPVPWRPNEP